MLLVGAVTALFSSGGSRSLSLLFPRALPLAFSVSPSARFPGERLGAASFKFLLMLTVPS